MYPPNLFWWIGGTVVVLGLLGILGMFVWWLDSKFEEHAKRHRNPPPDIPPAAPGAPSEKSDGSR